MPFTVATANKVLNKLLRNQDFQHPSKIYVSLHTGNPGENGANEVTGGGYKRQLATFSAPSNKQTSNPSDIEFNNMPACTITHIGLWDSETGGNFWWGGQLVASRKIDAGDTVRFKAGDLDAILE